jgi:3-oxoacyl-(acyl-carrier-protein) synthase
VRAVAGVCSLGHDRPRQVAAAREGRSGIGQAPASCLVAPAGSLAGWIPGQPSLCDDPRGIYRLCDEVLDRLGQEARWSDAERAQCGLFLGTTTGNMPEDELPAVEKVKKGLSWESQFLCGGPGRLACHVAQRTGLKGPIFTYTTACTSSGVALVMALQALRSGRLARALVFGADLVMKTSFEGFRLLGLYSEGRCRPFDRARDGLNLGEAGVAILLEAHEGPLRSRFEMLEGAIAQDPSHIAAGSTDGLTAATVMREAMRRSDVAPGQITAIKAHGTGTPANDLSELRGMAAVFQGRTPPFLSWKGFLGHTIGSSSAIEQVLSMWCLEEGFLPASPGFSTPPEEEPLSPLMQPLETAGKPGVYLFNSFGFGGTAVCYLMADRGSR